MVVHIPSFVHKLQLVCPIYLCMIPFWTTSNPILISDLANAICFDLCEILTTELISTSTPSLDHVQIWRCQRLWIHTWNMWWKLLGADKAWYFEVKVSSMILQEDWWCQAHIRLMAGYFFFIWIDNYIQSGRLDTMSTALMQDCTVCVKHWNCFYCYLMNLHHKCGT